MKKRIFVSYHFDQNQEHAQYIQRLIKSFAYEDISVDKGTKIDDENKYTDEQIRQKIRDKFLKDVNVTVVIVGGDTKNRKHIDWEIYGTIYNSKQYQAGGIVVVDCTKKQQNKSWLFDKDLVECYDDKSYPAERKWPEKIEYNFFETLPERLFNSINKNYIKPKSYNLSEEINHAIFPILPYNKIKSKPKLLRLAIEHSYKIINKNKGKWDQTKLRRKNSTSPNRKTFEQVPA